MPQRSGVIVIVPMVTVRLARSGELRWTPPLPPAKASPGGTVTIELASNVQSWHLHDDRLLARLADFVRGAARVEIRTTHPEVAEHLMHALQVMRREVGP